MTRNAEIHKPNPESHRADAATGDGGHATHGFPVVAATASVLLHVVVIAMLASAQLRPVPPGPEAGAITMRLTPAPATETLSPAEEEPEPETKTETEMQAQPTADMAPAPVGLSSVDDLASTDTPTADESPEDPSPARARTLRATVLEQVRAQSTESGREAGSALPWTSSGEPVSGVPGVRGWISTHVGAVTPGADTWRDNDGSSRGRYVLANGTVVCTRRRAPTIDELMNPWKSIAVTMGSICGRERPDAPHFSDPRVQPPPAAGRRPSATGG